MLINISEFISNSYKKEVFHPEIEFDQFDDGLIYDVVEKKPVVMNIENIGDSQVRFYGSVDITLDIPCGRCLTSVNTKVNFDFDQSIDFKKVQQGLLEDLDDASFIIDSSLDVDRFVYNEILIHLPAKTLCKPSCKGLCLKCGKNLNEGECDCDRAVLDPRMSAIRDIFNNFKEV